jgi:hypothetical protein
VFSHTAAGTPWVNQSWLPQLVMYGLYTVGGLPALALAVAVLVTATFAFVLGSGQSEGRYGPFWRAFIVLWAAISTGRVWAVRPHLVTFLMVAVWSHVLDRSRHGQTAGRARILWALPVLMLAWANSHGGFVIGFILLGAEIAGVLVDALWHRQFEGMWTNLRPLLIVTGLSALAALLNPQGVRLLIFPFQTLGSAAQQNMIAEWASPDFHAIDMLPFLGLLLATWSALAWSKEAIRGIEWCRLLMFTAIALRSGRYIGLCAVIIAPILVRHGGLALARLGANWGRHPSSGTRTRGSPILNGVLLFLLLIAAGVKISLPLSAETLARAQSQIFPVQAVEVLRSQQESPTLFNEYGWGGYLIWELYPDTPVFIDGRADPYGDELIAAYQQVISAQPSWGTVLETYQVQSALISPYSALASAMEESGEWTQTYRDSIAILFVRTPNTQ